MQRILIVEDEQKTGRYLQQGLVEEGYQADLFNNGRDGLGAASKGQYDLIILDVMLPFLDGWQIISALRESGHEEPVLFLTAKDNVRDKVKGLELGADDYGAGCTCKNPTAPGTLAGRNSLHHRRYDR